jgi:hypothetical protein
MGKRMERPAMRKLLRRLAVLSMLAWTSMAFVTVATPGVSSADCGWGWWDPVANECRPWAVPPPLACENGAWWDPVANVCRPPAVPPPPLCDNGWWWDPAANVCQPPLIPPPE